jgi:hypothetical protein
VAEHSAHWWWLKSAVDNRERWTRDTVTLEPHGQSDKGMGQGMEIWFDLFKVGENYKRLVVRLSPDIEFMTASSTKFKSRPRAGLFL